MMAGFAGADVDQLDALAAAFDRRADEFRRIGATATTSIMVAAWTGADVDRVRSEWNRAARPAIQNVASELTALATALRTQANEQREASGAAGPADWTLRLPDPWPMWTLPDFERIVPDFGRLAPGEVISIVWGSVGTVLDHELPGVPWSVADVVQFLPVVDTAVDIRDAIDRALQGEFPIHEAVDFFAGKVREVRHPVPYLIGSIVALGNDIWEEAAAADWSAQNMGVFVEAVTTDPLGSLAAAGEAIVDFMPDLVSNFKFW